MNARVEFFDNSYANFGDRVLAAVRQATFGHDIGQNSWLTVDEYERFAGWLDLVRSRAESRRRSRSRVQS